MLEDAEFLPNKCFLLNIGSYFGEQKCHEQLRGFSPKINRCPTQNKIRTMRGEGVVPWFMSMECF